MADLVTERAAFAAGFGNGEALIDALRCAELVVPLDIDGRIFTWDWAGLPWLTAFTDVAHCAAFARAAGRDLEAVKICKLPGAAVIDDLLDHAPTATGLVVDAASPDPLVFPPVRAFTPHRYVDEQTGQVVIA
jgi:hypothetical protein